ncbi:MAG: insulinase family protein [candidate division Zixibacteria bacterium]|nr:insulinase family protein [candidate division Zixibacteria bacterium]MCI0595926.1 insulinase family protein [candidate division Zixibacteria bacterium]
MKTKTWILTIAAGLLTIGLAYGQHGRPAESGTKKDPAKVSPGSKKVDALKYRDLVWSVPEVGKEVKKIVLASGMALYLYPDHALPVFNVQAIIRTGEIYEPMDKMGLSRLCGTVLRTGGTKTLSPDSLNAELEFMAGSVETGIGREEGSASLNVLAKDIDRGLEIFADVLMNPEFRPDKLDLAKDQIKEQIRRRNDQPGSILAREFTSRIYAGHPYGRILEWETVKKLTREDLLNWHKTYFAPNNVMLGISGDFDAERVVEKIKKLFARWEKKNINFPSIPKVADEPAPGIYVVDKPNLNQTNLTMGHLGVDFTNPDIYALNVMNYILGGGGFTSRLTSRVRSDLGLAYSVGSQFNTNSRDLGTFAASCQTKTETTHKAAAEMLAVIKKMREAPATEDELKTAKDAYINRFVFQFTSASSVVGQLMGLDYFGRDPKFYNNYLDNVRKVAAEDVFRVAKTYLKPENLTMVVVGNVSGFDADLSDLGPTSKVALTPPVVE